MMGKGSPVRSRRGLFSNEAREDGVALLSAIFFMVLAAGLSVVLLGAILSQAAPALIAQKNTRTIYSAQAGLQAALGLIRTSVDTTTGNGTTAGLPCAVTGRVTASGTGASYSVTVEYFTADPTNSTVDWRIAERLTCTTAGGVTDAGAPVTPKYAYVYSGGKDAATAAFTPVQGDRALSAVYKFKVTNVNIPGGMIYNDNRQYCLQATGVTSGSKVKFQSVASGCTNTDLQRWVYDDDYQLKLASTVILASPGVTASPGKCITGPATDGDGDSVALLQPCRTDSARWNQLWSWTGSYSWVGQKPGISTGPSSYCLSTGYGNGATIPASQRLQVKTSCLGQFSPSSSVGAGAASNSTHQIVNYLEFGRCADVTDITIGSSYMISFPCKQDPSGVTGMPYIDWNHKWFYTEPIAPATTLASQEIYVYVNNNTSQKYCLTAPAAVPITGELRFYSCSGAANQKWTRVKDTGDYASSYLLVDNTGRCMFVDQSAIHALTADIHKIRVTTCDGSLAQKWNAPAIYVNSTVGSYREVAN